MVKIVRVFLWVVAGLIGTASAQAQTELEIFLSTVSPGARYAFGTYKSCSLIVGSETRQAASARGHNASFEEIEAAIAEKCMKDLMANPQWTMLRISAAERDNLIKRFSVLALAERRLSYDGQPIPGVRIDPDTARLLKCTDSGVLKALDTCIVEETRALIRSSTEAPETIALAVDGACQGAQDTVVQQFSQCMGVDKARDAVRQRVKDWLSTVIAAVVKRRAESDASEPTVKSGPKGSEDPGK